jgi:hypothetical protein
MSAALMIGVARRVGIRARSRNFLDAAWTGAVYCIQ